MRTLGLLFLFVIAGCTSRELFSDKHDEIPVEDVTEIQLHLRPKNGEAEEHFSLTDKLKISALLNEINKGESAGPYKGLFDRIMVITIDSTFEFRTNGKVFAPDHSDWFFKFNSANPYRTYWGVKTIRN